MDSAWSPRKMALRPVSGCVRTIGCATGGTVAFCSAVSGSSPWRRGRGKSKFWMAGGVAAFALGLYGGRKEVVGRIHVGELGLAAFRRHDLRIHHRRLPGSLAPGAVGVPIERALVGMLAARIAVRVEAGQHVDLQVSR